MVKESCVNEKRDIHRVCRPNTHCSAAKEAHVCQKRRTQLVKVTYNVKKIFVLDNRALHCVYCPNARWRAAKEAHVCQKRRIQLAKVTHT